VDEQGSGQTLAALLKGGRDLSWGAARKLCERGKVVVNGQVETNGARRMVEGDRIAVHLEAPRIRRGALPRDRIVHVDREVVVVSKPAHLLSVPFDAQDKDTLIDLTTAALAQMEGGKKRNRAPLGAVQRLDKTTTGLLVFPRTLEAKRALQAQFRVHSVERSYWAIAHGRVTDATYETWLIRDRGDGLRGSHGKFRRSRAEPPADARRSVTHVRLVEDLGKASLVECRLETGRQHQIRIHLSEAGHALVGEGVYIRDHKGDRIPANRPLLHARTLGFNHPRTGAPMRFEEEPPEDFMTMLATLRRGESPP
ncbi:MAG: RluA family pseudouridine synthase, partial [Myxococcales bacterium]|nr:RluA family pseudouridine synthase [Myxococcales bacterium]